MSTVKQVTTAGTMLYPTSDSDKVRLPVSLPKDVGNKLFLYRLSMVIVWRLLFG